MHSGLQDEESLSFLEKNLDEHFEKEYQTKRKRSWKHKVKPCNDLEGALRRNNVRKLGTLENKDEAKESENLMSLRNKELITWMKQE